MKRKLTLEELAQVKEAYDEEGDVGALLVLMKLMGMEDYDGEYEDGPGLATQWAGHRVTTEPFAPSRRKTWIA